jgi:broad specificity phosphatase PhoE
MTQYILRHAQTDFNVQHREEGWHGRHWAWI